jgi:hypothetical protein
MFTYALFGVEVFQVRRLPSPSHAFLLLVATEDFVGRLPYPDCFQFLPPLIFLLLIHFLQLLTQARFVRFMAIKNMDNRLSSKVFVRDRT